MAMAADEGGRAGSGRWEKARALDAGGALGDARVLYLLPQTLQLVRKLR